MKKSGVYRIDLGNGWFYVGSSVDLKRRECEHRTALKRGEHHNPIAQRAFNKYGEFSFTVLRCCPVDQIIECEQELLDKHHGDPKCANIALFSAANPMTGRRHSPETRAKMRGRVASNETRAKMSAAWVGRVVSGETRAKQRANMTGRPGCKHSPESLKKIGDASRGRGAGVKKSPAHRAAIAAALTGNKHTPERRANMVAAWVTRRSKSNAARLALNRQD